MAHYSVDPFGVKHHEDIKHSSCNFIGRESELKSLHEAFKSNKRLVKIIGMGGIGKTELSERFAWEVLNRPNISSTCIWLNGRSKELLKTSIKESLSILKSNVEEPVEVEPLKTPEKETEVVDFFKSKEENITIHLVVIDDNDFDDTKDDVEKMIEYLQGKDCFVILTSRDRNILKYQSDSPSQTVVIDLDKFTEDDFMLFVKSVLETETDEDIQQLGKVTQNHPLAIRLAVKNIKENNLTIQAFLTKYRNKKTSFLGNLVDTKYWHQIEAPNAKTLNWKLDIEKLNGHSADGDKALQILCTISFMEQGNIEIELILKFDISHQENWFRKMFKKKELAWHNNPEKSIELLERYSLVKVDQNRKYLEEVSPLIQEVTRSLIMEGEKEPILLKLIKDARELITLKFIDNEDITHILSIWKHAVEFERIVKSCSNFLPEIANRLQFLSMYSEMLNWCEFIHFNIKPFLGDDHKDVIWMETSIATALLGLTLNSEALAKFEELMEKVKIHTNSQPDISIVMPNPDQAGKANINAAELRKQVFETKKIIEGENNVSTVEAKCNVAIELSDKGKLEEAVALYAKVLEWRTNNLGDRHEETLTVQSNLAICYGRLGNKEEMKRIFLQVISIREDNWGKEDSRTVEFKYNLAVLLSDLGEKDWAIEIMNEIVDLRETLLGQDHLLTNEAREASLKY